MRIEPVTTCKQKWSLGPRARSKLVRGQKTISPYSCNSLPCLYVCLSPRCLFHMFTFVVGCRQFNFVSCAPMLNSQIQFQIKIVQKVTVKGDVNNLRIYIQSSVSTSRIIFIDVYYFSIQNYEKEIEKLQSGSQNTVFRPLVSQTTIRIIFK